MRKYENDWWNIMNIDEKKVVVIKKILILFVFLLYGCVIF